MNLLKFEMIHRWRGESRNTRQNVPMPRAFTAARRTWPVLGILFFMVCQAPALSDEAPEQRRFSITEKRTIPWEQNRPIHVSEGEGSIYVRGIEKNEIQLKAIKTAFAPNIAAARRGASILRVSVEVPRDRIRVKTIRRSVFPDSAFGYIDYNVQAPAGIDLDVRTETGSISVEQITGSVSAQTASGTVSLRKLTGQTSVEAQKGEVNAFDCDGVMSIVVGQGNILFSTGLSAIADGTNLKTDSGDIEIEIPADLPATFDVYSGTGEIVFPGEEKGDVAAGNLGKGAAKGKRIFRNKTGDASVSVSTSAGKVVIRYRGRGPVDKKEEPEQE